MTEKTNPAETGTSYGKAVELAAGILADAGITDAGTDLFYLLQSVAGFSKADYLLKKNTQMPQEEAAGFFELVQRRAKHEPCQYIIGNTEFMGLVFCVSPDVLIPRQDTELLAETAISKIASLREREDLPEVLDLCTGSGALAVSIKKFCPEAEVTASDISQAALAVAKKNAQENGTEIRFIHSDLFEGLKGERFDIIVSNPPYVTEEEYQTLMEEVRCFEPKSALTAGADGLDFYRLIACQAKEHLKKAGSIMLEIGCCQAAEVSRLLEENGFADIRILQDLCGLDRVVTAQAPTIKS